jgi:hypothetical protein
VAIVLLLMHSAMDYPLRTTAMMAIFSFLLAFLMPAPSARKGVQRPSNPTPVPHQHSDTRRNHRRRQRLSSHRV